MLRIAVLAEQFDNRQVANDARSAARRVAEGRFYVACVGQFKRGKSTLLNALMGEPILPSGVAPVTTVPTILRFGESHAARVRLENGEWTDIAIADIIEYVSEARNPENSKGVAGLEIFVPSPLLIEGMCLVDTPGLGSVFAGNTAATQAFLPHIDAAIVVIGADPPLAGEELTLVESVAKQIPDILFVLNKADRVASHEREEAVSFARQVLERRLERPVHPILEVSALEQLDRGGSQRDWAQLVAALEQLVRKSGRRLVRDAAERSVRRFSGQLQAIVNGEREALAQPFEESERQIGRLREIVFQAEQSLNDLGHLLSGEQQRMSKVFGEHRDSFLKSVREPAQRELGEQVRHLPRTNGPRYRRSVMEAAQGVGRKHTMPWLETERENAEQAYGRMAKRFADLANDFLARIHDSRSQLSSLPGELDIDRVFCAPSEFRFYEFIHLALPASPVRYMVDLLLGAVRAHHAIDGGAGKFLDLLLEANSERVRNDLEQRVSESRRHLEAEVRAILRELCAAAERALARARVAHAQGAASVELSLRKLCEIEAELACLCGAKPSQLERL
ncbi:MAG: dynamin family protein [Terriglobales bacterium]